MGIQWKKWSRTHNETVFFKMIFVQCTYNVENIGYQIDYKPHDQIVYMREFLVERRATIGSHSVRMPTFQIGL